MRAALDWLRGRWHFAHVERSAPVERLDPELVDSLVAGRALGLTADAAVDAARLHGGLTATARELAAAGFEVEP